MGQNPILLGGVESPVGIHDTHTTQQLAIGAVGELPDGRRFRYAKADGTGVGAGIYTVSPAPTTANHKNIAVPAAVPIGMTNVTVTLGATAATVDQYAGGFLWVNDGTGEGHLYRIRTHPAANASAALTVVLADPIKVALVSGATSEVTLITNPYNAITVGGATPATKIAGVAPVAIGANAFGWIQTRGLCSVLEGGTDPTAGDFVSAAASGAVQLPAVDATAAPVLATFNPLGVCQEVVANSGDQVLVFLTLE